MPGQMVLTRIFILYEGWLGGTFVSVVVLTGGTDLQGALKDE